MISKIRSHWYTAPPVFLGLALAQGAGYTVHMDANAQRVEAEHWTNHTLEVLANIDQIQAATDLMESRLSRYVLTGQSLYFEQFSDARCLAPVLVAQLRSCTADSPTQQQQVSDLEVTLRAKKRVMEHVVYLYDRQGFAPARAFVMQGRGETTRQGILKALDVLRATENRKLVLRRNKAARIAESEQKLSYVLLGLTGVLILLFCAMAWRGGKELGETQRRRDPEDVVS